MGGARRAATPRGQVQDGRWEAHGDRLRHSPEIPVCLASPGSLHQHLWAKVLTAARLACHFRPKQVTTYPPPSPGVSHQVQPRSVLGDVTDQSDSLGTADGQVHTCRSRRTHTSQAAPPPRRCTRALCAPCVRGVRNHRLTHTTQLQTIYNLPAWPDVCPLFPGATSRNQGTLSACLSLPTQDLPVRSFAGSSDKSTDQTNRRGHRGGRQGAPWVVPARCSLVTSSAVGHRPRGAWVKGAPILRPCNEDRSGDNTQKHTEGGAHQRALKPCLWRFLQRKLLAYPRGQGKRVFHRK